jgi:hypothetical protein
VSCCVERRSHFFSENLRFWGIVFSSGCDFGFLLEEVEGLGLINVDPIKLKSNCRNKRIGDDNISRRMNRFLSV